MPAVYLERPRKFLLLTDRTAYCFGVDPEANLQNLYWGRRLTAEDDYPDCRRTGQTVGIGKNLANSRRLRPDDFFYPYEADRAVINEEYPGWGGLNFVEPSLKLIFPDGVRDLLLKYREHRFDSDAEVVVTLSDAHYPLLVHLHYRVLADVDLILRWAEIENRCQGSVRLESVQSGVVYPTEDLNYRLSYLTGRWGDEFNLTQTEVHQGKMIMESRRGVTSHHAHPWFALDPDGTSTEDTGRVWFGALAWSGNWKIVAEYTSNRQMRVTAGINDFDFAWELGPGEAFETPQLIAGYTEGGFGESSRLLHRFGLRHVSPAAHRSNAWPVFYNTWETYWFDIDETRLLALAERAADLGVEVFHVDDGWFSTRQDEYSGLGDWWVSPAKFPSGLRALSERVRSLGMLLSLWIEPENVNPDSEIYRTHPDWVYGFPTRSPSLQRESLILNFGREDVREYIWQSFVNLINEHQISHFKWDLNRHMSEPGWIGLPADRQKELWVRHVLGVYEIMERIQDQFPNVTLECCAGGGGRVDYGILRYCDISLPSDNHDPLARLRIQEGYSYVYPARTMGAWVTDTPSPLTRRSLPLKFMFHAAMTGALGIQANILEWNEEETALARELIRQYKELRPIVHGGDQYRLTSLRQDHIAAVEYVGLGAEHAVVFAFMDTNPVKPPARVNILHWGSPRFSFTLFPRGLLPDQRYHVDGGTGTRSGQALMSTGINVELSGDGDSRLIRIDASYESDRAESRRAADTRRGSTSQDSAGARLAVADRGPGPADEKH